MNLKLYEFGNLTQAVLYPGCGKSRTWYWG